MAQSSVHPALTVTFAGSGDAFGSGGRFQACIHLRPASAAPVLLDCGATSLSALKGLGVDPGETAAVFVSHLHGDHFGGLPLLILDAQFSRRTKPLAVVGPPGIARRLSDTMECLFPGSSKVSRRFEADVTELAPGTTVTVCGVTAQAWEGDHPSLPVSRQPSRRWSRRDGCQTTCSLSRTAVSRLSQHVGRDLRSDTFLRRHRLRPSQERVASGEADCHLTSWWQSRQKSGLTGQTSRVPGGVVR